MSFIDDLASAIARFEGFFSAGSLAQRNNNPGNLRAGVGQTGTDANGYAIFPDPATGFSALNNQIALNISKGLSLNTFFAGQRDSSGNVIPGGYPGYAPSADSNQPAQYASTVAGWLGIDPNTPLSTIASTDQSLPPSGSFPSTPSDTIDSIISGTAGISTTAIIALAVLAVGALAIVTSSRG